MVFISYATQNRARAKRFAKALKEENISYWMGPESVRKGKDFAEEIVWAIKTCEYFVLLLSRDAEKSAHVRKEIEFAIKYHKKIIPVKLYRYSIGEVFYYLLTDIQIEDSFNSKTGRGYKQVVDQCRLGEKVVNIQLSKNPFRDLTIMKGDYQDNLDAFLRKETKRVVNNTVFVMGLDQTSRVDIASSGGIVKYVAEYLNEKHGLDLKTLQAKIYEAKKEQLGKNEDELLDYEESVIIKVPTKYKDKYLNLMLIANSSKKDDKDVDNIEGADSRKVIISAFDRAIKEKFKTIFIGAMGTNGLSFPYQVVIAEIINAYAHASGLKKPSINRLVCSIRQSDMEKAGISIDQIMNYIGTVTRFI